MKTKEKKQKEKKPKKTAKQRAKVALKIILSIILVIAILLSGCAIVSAIGISKNTSFIENSIPTVEIENQLVPTLDDDGNYTFVTDDDFKVVQLTDVHIGAGFLSISKDNKAINAVAAMIAEEKPDLVIATGDISYPVPFQAGTLNNKNSAEIFAELMEKLGVYWCVAFGNHDTELYSYYSRQSIAKLYENREKYPHCLFQAGDENIDGYGNYVIKVKNTSGKITQSFFMFDSGSYVDGDYFGVEWKYDCIHENQVEWYKTTIDELTEENGGEVPSSLAFMHIPPIEMQEAYYAYRDNGYSDTDDVKYLFGEVGEHKKCVYSSTYNYGFVDALLEKGSTKGVFFGHDHLNNISFDYKGIQMTYGCSIDYLAYIGIKNYGSQRGCTVITCKPDSTFDVSQENYYQDKYQPVNEKEEVSMDGYYSEEE